MSRDFSVQMPSDAFFVVFYHLTPVELARLIIVSRRIKSEIEKFFANDLNFETYVQYHSIPIQQPRLETPFDETVLYMGKLGVYCWGSNAEGQLGFGDTHDRYRPTELSRNSFPGLPIDDYVIQITYDLVYNTALTKRGRLFTWGKFLGSLQPTEFSANYRNLNRPLFIDMSEEDRIVHVITAPLEADALSSEKTYALTDQGRIYCWITSHSMDQTEPYDFTREYFREMAPDDRIIQLSRGFKLIGSVSQYFALTQQGRVYVWGWRNDHGQLGLGDNQERRRPTELLRHQFPDMPEEDRIIQISAGHQYTLALTQQGRVYAWGKNDYGQLGLGDNEDRNQPTLLQNCFSNLSRDDRVVQIIAAFIQSFALTNQGRLYVWGVSELFGPNERQSNELPLLRPTEVPRNDFPNLPPTDHIVQIAVGYLHMVVLTEQGRLYALGNNEVGQLGLGARDTSTRPRPTQLPPNSIPTLSQWGFIHSLRAGKCQRQEALQGISIVSGSEQGNRDEEKKGDIVKSIPRNFS